jgi:hypothetical protein
MISALTSVRAVTYDPTADSGWLGQTPPSTSTGDDGWLGQVPPPSRASAAAPARARDEATGYESPHDAREAGWLGQTPPPSQRSTPPTDRAPASDATGHESPHDARESGWLGQTPPPTPVAEEASPPARPSYANPQLAPEPWKHDAPLFPDDPTLFG